MGPHRGHRLWRPAHDIALLRKLCVEERGWLGEHEFEDGISATNLLPGPASTQLAILCGWRLRGRVGGLVGGVCFIVPGLVIILALSVVFLAHNPPLWIQGAAAGAGAAVPAVALNAALGLIPASWRRTGSSRSEKFRWLCYFLAGGASAAVIGPYLVLVLLGCGIIEIAVRGGFATASGRAALFLPAERSACGGGRSRRAVLGCSQGRSSLLWGRLRHCPAHAARRRRHLSLDDGCTVPERRGARPDHSRPSRPDCCRRGLCRWRTRRGSLGCSRRLRPLLLLHPRRRITFRPPPGR